MPRGCAGLFSLCDSGDPLSRIRGKRSKASCWRERPAGTTVSAQAARPWRMPRASAQAAAGWAVQGGGRCRFTGVQGPPACVWSQLQGQLSHLWEQRGTIPTPILIGTLASPSFPFMGSSEEKQLPPPWKLQARGRWQRGAAIRRPREPAELHLSPACRTQEP